VETAQQEANQMSERARERGARRRALVVVSLTAVAVLIGGALLPLGEAQAAGDCTVSAAEAAMDGEEQAVLSAINAHRQANGRTPLAASGTLTRAAAWKARDNALNGTIHVDSLNRLPHVMNRDCGYGGSITGENVAAGQQSSAAVVEAWKTSPSHNQNMLRAEFVAAGVGRHASASSAYGVFWALELGNVADGGTAAPATSQPTTTTPTVTNPTNTTSSAPTTSPGNPVGASGTTNAAPGMVAVSTVLLGPSGQQIAGDASGIVFTLTGASPGAGTYTLPPTNAAGQTTLTVPPGTYIIHQQPKVGLTLQQFSANSVVVLPGQQATVTAIERLAAAPTSTTVTPGAPSTSTQTAPAATTQNQAAASAAATQTVSLAQGCTNVVLTWPGGTAISTVIAAISSPSAVAAIWRWNPTTRSFSGFAPAAAAVSDYKVTEQPYEAVYVCLQTPATLTRPAMR
jgi:uncharacterized protein YkwD